MMLAPVPNTERVKQFEELVLTLPLQVRPTTRNGVFNQQLQLLIPVQKVVLAGLILATIT